MTCQDNTICWSGRWFNQDSNLVAAMTQRSRSNAVQGQQRDQGRCPPPYVFFRRKCFSVVRSNCSCGSRAAVWGRNREPVCQALAPARCLTSPWTSIVVNKTRVREAQSLTFLLVRSTLLSLHQPACDRGSTFLVIAISRVSKLPYLCRI
jgi:hypothetical protein